MCHYSYELHISKYFLTFLRMRNFHCVLVLPLVEYFLIIVLNGAPHCMHIREDKAKMLVMWIHIGPGCFLNITTRYDANGHFISYNKVFRKWHSCFMFFYHFNSTYYLFQNTTILQLDQYIS